MGALLHVALVVCYALVQVANAVPDPSQSVRVRVRVGGQANGHTYLQRGFHERNKNPPGQGGKCRCPHDYSLKHNGRDNIDNNIDVTWKCHEEGLCYAHIATIRLNWYQASDYCKNLSMETGIADEWKTGMAAPADMEYLKEIANAFGHPDRVTRPSGPWIAGTDANTEGEWEWKGIADNLKFDRGEIPNGGFFDDGGRKENCLEILNNEGYVNDLDCKVWEFAFVCEAQKKSIKHF